MESSANYQLLQEAVSYTFLNDKLRFAVAQMCKFYQEVLLLKCAGQQLEDNMDTFLAAMCGYVQKSYLNYTKKPNIYENTCKI